MLITDANIIKRMTILILQENWQEVPEHLLRDEPFRQYYNPHYTKNVRHVFCIKIDGKKLPLFSYHNGELPSQCLLDLLLNLDYTYPVLTTELYNDGKLLDARWISGPLPYWKIGAIAPEGEAY